MLDSLKSCLSSLLISLPPRPLDQAKLNELVEDALKQINAKTEQPQKIGQVVPEHTKSQWEYLLKNEVFLLAVGARYKKPTVRS